MNEIKLPKITKQEFLDAISYGIKNAIHEMVESGDGFTGSIRSEEFFESIRNGVKDAIIEKMIISFSS